MTFSRSGVGRGSVRPGVPPLLVFLARRRQRRSPAGTGHTFHRSRNVRGRYSAHHGRARGRELAQWRFLREWMRARVALASRRSGAFYTALRYEDSVTFFKKTLIKRRDLTDVRGQDVLGTAARARPCGPHRKGNGGFNRLLQQELLDRFAGFSNASRLRGRSLNSAATHLRFSSEWIERSLPGRPVRKVSVPPRCQRSCPSSVHPVLW